MAAARDGNGRGKVVELAHDHSRFLDDLIETIRGRTGIVLDTSDVLSSLIDVAMEQDLSEVNIDAECGRAQTLSMLLGIRREIVQEMRQTESDLHQTLIHSPNDGDSVKNFRRNLRYQRDRLESLSEQMAQFRRSNGGRGNGASELLQALLSRHLCPEVGK